MAYNDQQMSGNRITVLIIVALIHIFLGYALVTGLAYSAAQQIIKKVTTVDIKKEEPKKPPPPPPKPKNLPPPPVAPPVKINVAVTPPQIQTVTTPPPPPAPKFSAKPATPRGDPGSWVTTDDYPARALREERQGTTRIHFTVGPNGRVTDCQVASSSGSPDLDETACTVFSRRAKYSPATDTNGQPTTWSTTQSIRWVVPKD